MIVCNAIPLKLQLIFQEFVFKVNEKFIYGHQQTPAPADCPKHKFLPACPAMQ